MVKQVFDNLCWFFLKYLRHITHLARIIWILWWEMFKLTSFNLFGDNFLGFVTECLVVVNLLVSKMFNIHADIYFWQFGLVCRFWLKCFYNYNSNNSRYNTGNGYINNNVTSTTTVITTANKFYLFLAFLSLRMEMCVSNKILKLVK